MNSATVRNLLVQGMLAGLATGVLVYGVAFGGVAALAYCFALGRVGRFSPRPTALLLSAIALLAVYVVPFLKYPANPPAVGNPDTIGRRTTLYFLMMLLSVLIAIAATVLGKRLVPGLGTWWATVTAVAAFALVIGLAYAFLPAVNEVPKDFPATVLWRFRLSALAGHRHGRADGRRAQLTDPPHVPRAHGTHHHPGALRQRGQGV